ncbi:aminoglycoside phosphotransferase family protein, partial [Streptomyces sp. NPDC001795]
MSRTISAWVTSGADVLGVAGPFPVDVPWWSEVEPVVGRLEDLLGVPVLVLRLLTVDGGEGVRDGHATYHVEALGRPAHALLDQRPVDADLLTADDERRMPWARADGLREQHPRGRRPAGGGGGAGIGMSNQSKTKKKTPKIVCQV